MSSPESGGHITEPWRETEDCEFRISLHENTRDKLVCALAREAWGQRTWGPFQSPQSSLFTTSLWALRTRSYLVQVPCPPHWLSLPLGRGSQGSKEATMNFTSKPGSAISCLM